MPQFLSSAWASSDMHNRLTVSRHHHHHASPQSNNNSGGGTPDLTKLLNSTACNVSLGLLLLLVGIVVTAMTFKEYKNTNKIFLLGPILVGAGMCVITVIPFSYSNALLLHS